MDVYDDDPIRKDAVQHENLVVIQAGKHTCMQAGSVLPWLCFNFFLPGEPAFHPVDLCVSGAKPSRGELTCAVGTGCYVTRGLCCMQAQPWPYYQGERVLVPAACLAMVSSVSPKRLEI